MFLSARRVPSLRWLELGWRSLRVVQPSSRVGALERRSRLDVGYHEEAAVAAEALLLDDWFDAIEDGVRALSRIFI